MMKEEIVAFLSGWNFWNRTTDTGVKREMYLDKAFRFLGAKSNKVLVINGIRRSGKSILTKQIVKEFINRGANPRDTLIVNLEEAKFDEEPDLSFLLKIYDAYLEIIKPKGKPLIVLDEVQEVSRWEKFARSMQEKDEAKIIITGSSSKIMSDELATLLTGRTLEIEFFPLDFKEFLNFREFEFKEYSDLLIRKRDVMDLLREYMEFGGFPEIAFEEDDIVKKAILKKYYDDIISKDVVRRYRIRNIRKIEVLANYYINSISSPVTFNSVSRFLNLPLKTVEIYSKYLETSKLLFFVSRFSFSIKERENSPRKVYAIDSGIVNSVSFKFTGNFGKIYENAVAVELKRRGKEFYYWKDQKNREVDFVIKEGLKVSQLIQVCYNIENPETKEREFKALIKAGKELKCKNLMVITHDLQEKEEAGDNEIIYVPLWKWLLV